MLIITLIFGSLGFISPEHRGSLLTMLLLLFVFMGLLSGYFSARFYKKFNGVNWFKNALLTAVLFPSFAFSLFSLVNLFLILEGSVGAISFSTLVTLLTLWLCCSSPLVLIGAFLGNKKNKFSHPGKVNRVPTQIPIQPWYLRTTSLILFAGFPSFG